MALVNLRDCLIASLIDLGNFWFCFRASCWLQDEIKNTSQFTISFGFRLKSSPWPGRAELSPPRFAHLFWACRILEQLFSAISLKMLLSSYTRLCFK